LSLSKFYNENAYGDIRFVHGYTFAKLNIMLCLVEQLDGYNSNVTVLRLAM